MDSKNYGISKKSYIESKIVIWTNAVSSYLVQIEVLEGSIEQAQENIVDLEQELYELQQPLKGTFRKDEFRDDSGGWEKNKEGILF